MFSIYIPKENDYVTIIPNDYDKEDSYINVDLVDYNLKGILPLTIVSNRKRVKNYKKYLKPGVETVCKVETIININNEYKITLSYHYTDNKDEKYSKFIDFKKNIKNIKNVFLHLENIDEFKRNFNQLIIEYFKPIEEKWIIKQELDVYKFFIENVKYLPIIQIINAKNVCLLENKSDNKKIGLIIKDFNKHQEILDLLNKYNSKLILEATPYYRYQGNNYDDFLNELNKIESILVKYL
jgi:hypothetical protein